MTAVNREWTLFKMQFDDAVSIRETSPNRGRLEPDSTTNITAYVFFKAQTYSERTEVKDES